MTRKTLFVSLVLVALVAAGGWGVYRLGLQRGQTLAAAPAGAGSSAAADPAGGAAAPPAAGATDPAARGEDATRRHIAAGLKAGDIDPLTGKKILYYHDPMVPASRFDKPARSPFMDMMLWPVFAGGDSDAGSVTVSPRIQQSLGVRTAPVTRGTLAQQVSAVGSIAFNERDQAIVQARATGFVERLHVRATLDAVARGRPLVDLYVPDWIAAQEEFLSVRGMQGPDLAVLVDGARQRMRLAGMSAEQIALVERTGRTQPRTTLVAPIGGVVVELLVREGMTVMAGATLFRINGLATVWANAEVPESQSALLRPGTRVQARSPAVPGTTFEGKVQAILPDVNAATRTLKARVELANPGSRLVPGMFVQMQFMDLGAEQALLVPTEAVIQTGRRSVVLLAEADGRFRPVEVETGAESGGRTEIRRGLEAGQQVVVSSQFLIDSEASLQGVEARLDGAAGGAAPGGSASASPGSAGAGAGAGAAAGAIAGAGAGAPAAVRAPARSAVAGAAAGTSVGAGSPRHAAEGRVESVGQEDLTLSHGPIASLKWGPMTMDFKLPPAGAPRGLQPGDRIAFEFFMDPEGLPRLTTVRRLAAAPGQPPPPAAGGKP